MKNTIVFPHPPGSGGPGSFQRRFEQELISNNYHITYADTKVSGDIVFIVGGTGKIFWLLKMKLKGVPIIYRLDGINWLHRKKRGKRGIKAYLSAEISNLITKTIHAFFADFIVYQSEFVHEWWNKKGWKKPKHFSIIYNAVNLSLINPEIKEANTPKLVCLEGYLDYSPYAIDLINDINKRKIIDFDVYGGILSNLERSKLSKDVCYKGKIDRKLISSIFTGNIYLSLDINPACPNTVIEALACGAPVVAFDTGSLKELVPPEAGIIVPYGSDPWQLAYPDVDALAKAILKVKDNYAYYSANARKLAEERYSIKDMTTKYLEVINSLI